MKQVWFEWIAHLDRWATRLFNPLMSLYYRFRYRATGNTLLRLERELTTPEAIAAWVEQNITYKMDPVSGLLNNIQQPEVTLARGAGDCDDFSYLCLHLLRRRGYPVWLLTLFTTPIQQSHTVCVFEDGGTYHHISNWGLRREAASSIAAVAFTVLPVWHSGHLQTPDLKTIEVFTPETIEAAAAVMESMG